MHDKLECFIELNNEVIKAKNQIDGQYACGFHGNEYNAIDTMHEKVLDLLQEYEDILNDTIEKEKTKELSRWEEVQYRMNNEGFDYCFLNYSSFREIEDKEFHRIRTEYVEASYALRNYIEKKVKLLNT